MKKYLKKLSLFCIVFCVLLMNPNGIYASTVKTLKDVNSLDSITFYYNNVKDLDAFWKQWEQDGAIVEDVVISTKDQEKILRTYREEYEPKTNCSKSNLTRDATVNASTKYVKIPIVRDGILLNTTVTAYHTATLNIVTRTINGQSYELFVSIVATNTIMDSASQGSGYILANCSERVPTLKSGKTELEIYQQIQFGYTETVSVAYNYWVLGASMGTNINYYSPEHLVTSIYRLPAYYLTI